MSSRDLVMIDVGQARLRGCNLVSRKCPRNVLLALSKALDILTALLLSLPFLSFTLDTYYWRSMFLATCNNADKDEGKDRELLFSTLYKAFVVVASDII